MSSVEVDDGTQVLEFTIGEESYCIEIECVTEIVDGGETTSIPDTPEHVAGVMSLRGRTTTIIEPRVLLDGAEVSPDDLIADGGETDHRIVVFDQETIDTDGAVGWNVSEVAEVAHVSEDSIETAPVSDTDLFRGIVKRDDEFLLWINSEAVGS
jgi:purine-binding chemotaxis protein CheW